MSALSKSTSLHNSRAETIRKLFSLLNRDGIGVNLSELHHITAVLRNTTGSESLDSPGVLGSIDDVTTELQDYADDFLADLVWFAEDVVRVERDLRTAFVSSVERWRSVFSYLAERSLAALVLAFVPERIGRWVGLRLRPKDTTGLRYGFSQSEAEELWAEATDADVLSSLPAAQHVYAVSIAVDDFVANARVSWPADDVSAAQIAAAVTSLVELSMAAPSLDDTLRNTARGVGTSSPDGLTAVPSLAVSKRLWAATFVARGGLSPCTRLLCDDRTPDAVRADILTVVTSALSHELHVSIDPAELLARDAALGFIGNGDLASFVRGCIAVGNDYVRATGVDSLHSWDRARLTDTARMRQSLLLRGDVMMVISARLNLWSHHTLHEPRTPIRAHLVGLLASVLDGGAAVARPLLRRANTLTALASIFAGPRGHKRSALSNGDEFDELTFDGEHCDGGYYERDFVDDEYTGRNDSQRVVELLCALLDEWGTSFADELVEAERVLELLLESANTLSSELLESLLSSSKVPNVLDRYAMRTGEELARQATLFATPAGDGKPIPPLVCSADHTLAAIQALGKICGHNATVDLLTRAKGAIEARVNVDIDIETIRRLVSLLASAMPMRPGDLPALVATTATVLRRHRIERGSHAMVRAHQRGSNTSAPAPPTSLVRSVGALQLAALRATPCAYSYNVLVTCERVLAEPPVLVSTRADGGSSLLRERGAPTRALAARYPQTSVSALLASMVSLSATAAHAQSQGDSATFANLAWYFVFELCYVRRDAVAAAANSDVASIVGLSTQSLQQLLALATREPESMAVEPATTCCGAVIVNVLSMRTAFVQVAGLWHLWAGADAPPLYRTEGAHGHFSLQQ